MSGDMGELIKRLEKATGPDRELDAEIAKAVGWRCVGFRTGYTARVGTPPEQDGKKGRGVMRIPHYTASLDAAMTLAPTGWTKDLFEQDTGLWHAGLRKPGLDVGTDNPVKYPAIALCIASLKARHP